MSVQMSRFCIKHRLDLQTLIQVFGLVGRDIDYGEVEFRSITYFFPPKSFLFSSQNCLFTFTQPVFKGSDCDIISMGLVSFSTERFLLRVSFTQSDCESRAFGKSLCSNFASRFVSNCVSSLIMLDCPDVFLSWPSTCTCMKEFKLYHCLTM